MRYTPLPQSESLPADRIDATRAAYRATGGLRSNLRYGYVATSNRR